MCWGRVMILGEKGEVVERELKRIFLSFCKVEIFIWDKEVVMRG